MPFETTGVAVWSVPWVNLPEAPEIIALSQGMMKMPLSTSVGRHRAQNRLLTLGDKVGTSSATAGVSFSPNISVCNLVGNFLQNSEGSELIGSVGFVPHLSATCVLCFLAQDNHNYIGEMQPCHPWGNGQEFPHLTHLGFLLPRTGLKIWWFVNLSNAK